MTARARYRSTELAPGVMGRRVAILFAYPNGPYAESPGVDIWGEDRDARTYTGADPVVAHPPCSRWCRLAGLVEARWGHRRGEDGGMFASALANVRRVGGVLEHPAYSDAWAAFGLPIPGARGWQRGSCGGWSCYVEQGRYGHAAKKATWLYAFGVDLPTLRWGREADSASRALVSWCGNHNSAGMAGRPRVGKRRAAETPPRIPRPIARHSAYSACRRGLVMDRSSCHPVHVLRALALLSESEAL